MKKLAFKEIKETVRKVNPEFVEIVESVKGAEDCGAYLAEYRYGDYIVNSGGFNLPVEGELKDLRACDETIKADLGYSLMTNPICLCLNKSVELYSNHAGEVTPFKIYKPGDLFGFTFVVSQCHGKAHTPSAVNIWDVTAGVRNIALLPSLSDGNGLNALMREFEYICVKPESLFDHWQVLKGIGYHDPDWVCKMLYFDIDWFNNLSTTSWLPLRLYFYDQFNIAMQFYANYVSWNISFSLAQTKKNIIAPVPVHETIKYLFGVATGFLNGHKVANNEISLPLKFIQDGLQSVYAVMRYAPIVMEPATFEGEPVYYSLQYPMHSDSIKLDSSRSIIKRHDDLYHALNRYKSAFSSSLDQCVDDTPLIRAAGHMKFDFYHKDPSNYEYMLSSKELIKEFDFATAMQQFSGLEFPNTARYFNGAIRITPTNKTSSGAVI